MYRYKIYGLFLETEIEFKQLVPAGTFDESDVVRIVEEDVEEEVIRRLTEADALKCKYTIGLETSAFMNIGGYYLIKGGKTISFKTKEGYDAQKVSVWLMGFCLAMALLQRGTLAMHCSALLRDKDAFLIVGVPGAGKSSLTRALIESGYGFMADDVAAVRYENGENTVYPAFPYQKLCTNELEKRNINLDELIHVDSDKDKYLVPIGDKFNGNPHPLKALVMITIANIPDVIVQRVMGFDTYRVIRENLFLHKLKGAWENEQKVVEASFKMAGSVPIYLIARPAGKDTLEEVKGEVMKIVEEM